MAGKKNILPKQKTISLKRKKSIPINKKETLKSVCTDAYCEEDLAKIRGRAYYIWERKGRPENGDFDNWLEAEAELKAEGLI